MSALTVVPAGPASRPARLASLAEAALSGVRLLRIELRRSALPLFLPLVAALFWFDSYRPSTVMPSQWVLRTFWNLGQGHTIIDFGPFVAGAAAWVASRDGRRGIADLMTTAARPRWAAQLATWAATAIWAVGGYLAFVGVLFAVYAWQGVQGQPPWWWVAVGASAVAAFSAAGFAVGAFFPSRFAAPLAAFGGFLVTATSSQTGFTHTSGWALILPTNSNGNFQPDSGLLYPWLPDLPIARMMFLGGLLLAVLGLLGLPARAGSARLRLVALALALSGVAAAGTAVGLAGTARLGPHGLVIAALHDSANDRPLSLVRVCGHRAAIPVCVSPFYGSDLPLVMTALAPVTAEVAGLPGAPVRAIQVPATYSPRQGQAGHTMAISDHPPVLQLPLGDLGQIGAFGRTRSDVDSQFRVLFLHAFVGAGNGAGTRAQRAVQAALLQGIGVPIASQPGLLRALGLPSWARSAAASKPVYVAAGLLAALPAAARQRWLAAHLVALRSGRLTLARLP